MAQYANHWRVLVAALMVVGLVVGMVCPAAGQRLHDASKAQLTQDAVKKFDDVASKNNDLYELALKNVKVVHAADLEMLRQRNKATLNSELEILPTMTWAGLFQRLTEKRQQLLTHMPSGALSTGGTAEEKKAALRKKIDDLQKRIAEVNSASQTALPTVKDIHTFLNNAIQTGQIQKTDLSSLQAKAKQLPDLFGQLKKIEIGLVAAPRGLEPVILDSQLKQAQIELDRISLQQQHDKDMEDALKSQLALVSELTGEVAVPLSCGSRDDIGIFRYFRALCVEDHASLCAKKGDLPVHTNRFDAQPDEMIVVTVGRLAQQASALTSCGISATAALQKLLSLLSLYGSIVGVRTYMAEAADLNFTNDELEFQIRLAQLNAREHEELIASALKGLDVFEQGGVKPEDIANLIRAAQLAATSVIAGRVH